jgi:hypothetical protein
MRSGAVLLPWKAAPLHIVDILLRPLDDHLAKIRVPLHKPGDKAIEEPERVIADQNLSIAIGSRSDADRRDSQFGCDSARQLSGNGFEHHRERACLLQRARILDDVCRFFFRLADGAEAAELVDGLRSHAEMPHHGNTGLDQTPNHIGDRSSTFQLDCVSAALLQKPACIAKSLFRVELVGEERHIRNDQRPFGAPGDGC